MCGKVTADKGISREVLISAAADKKRTVSEKGSPRADNTPGSFYMQISANRTI